MECCIGMRMPEKSWTNPINMMMKGKETRIKRVLALRFQLGEEAKLTYSVGGEDSD
jgi:hypothetical protein